MHDPLTKGPSLGPQWVLGSHGLFQCRQQTCTSIYSICCGYDIMGLCYLSSRDLLIGPTYSTSHVHGWIRWAQSCLPDLEHIEAWRYMWAVLLFTLSILLTESRELGHWHHTMCCMLVLLLVGGTRMSTTSACMFVDTVQRAAPRAPIAPLWSGSVRCNDPIKIPRPEINLLRGRGRVCAVVKND